MLLITRIVFSESTSAHGNYWSHWSWCVLASTHYNICQCWLVVRSLYMFHAAQRHRALVYRQNNEKNKKDLAIDPFFFLIIHSRSKFGLIFSYVYIERTLQLRNSLFEEHSCKTRYVLYFTNSNRSFCSTTCCNFGCM